MAEAFIADLAVGDLCVATSRVRDTSNLYLPVLSRFRAVFTGLSMEDHTGSDLAQGDQRAGARPFCFRSFYQPAEFVWPPPPLVSYPNPGLWYH